MIDTSGQWICETDSLSIHERLRHFYCIADQGIYHDAVRSLSPNHLSNMGGISLDISLSYNMVHAPLQPVSEAYTKWGHSPHYGHHQPIQWVAGTCTVWPIFIVLIIIYDSNGIFSFSFAFFSREMRFYWEFLLVGGHLVPCGLGPNGRSWCLLIICINFCFLKGSN
jgi:hypothetical protein